MHEHPPFSYYYYNLPFFLLIFIDLYYILIILDTSHSLLNYPLKILVKGHYLITYASSIRDKLIYITCKGRYLKLLVRCLTLGR